MKAHIWTGGGKTRAKFDIGKYGRHGRSIEGRPHTKLVEAVADRTTRSWHPLLEGKEINATQLQAGIRRLVIKNDSCRSFAGGVQEQGVQPLLVPSLITYHPLLSLRFKAQTLIASSPRQLSDDNAPFAALAFKLWTDPSRGRLIFFRTYSGKIAKGHTGYNPRQ